MSRTNGRYEMKVGNTDAIAVFGPNDIDALATADCVLTRAAAGDYNYSVGNTKTVTFALNLGKLLQRTGQLPFLQEQFGTAAGAAGPSAVANTTAPDANPTPYIPPFPGAGVNLIPATGFTPKGVKINSFKIVYSIGTANLTAHTCRVDKTVYANNVAPAVTSVLASGVNGLSVIFTANPYVTSVALAAGSQIYRVTDLSSLTLEIGAQTPGTGTYKLHRIEVLYDFNFN